MTEKYTSWGEKNAMRKMIREDLDACAGSSIGKRLSTMLFDAGFKAVRKYRLANVLYYKYKLRILPRWLRYRNRVKYSVDIDFRARIGGGFRLIHGIGVVIGYDVQIGRNVSLYQGVTLGGNNNRTATRDGNVFSQPWLSDNVQVFANCTVIGPVYIGKNSQIGAGTVLTKDVPENCVAYCKRETAIKERVQNT